MAQFDATLPCVGMYPGDTEVISSATSLTGANLSRAVAPINSIGGNPANLTLVNKSAAVVNVYVSRDYVAADFEPLAGVSCAGTSAISFSTTAPFVAVKPATDPGTGEISLCR